MVKGHAGGKPKLPSKQLAILAICRFAEPVALTSVYPYLPEMIESFGVGKKDVAKWAGITSAVFSLSQCVTAIMWGTASDRFGRKPVILVALTCTMFSSLFWGLSTSLPMAILARALAGACNGNVGVIRTTVAEMVPEKELQPRAFSVMPLVWSMGSIFGPTFGGFFAKPAENLPDLFGHNKFLIKYPFALPNIVASFFFLTGITIGFLFLKETLETKKTRLDFGRELGKRLISTFSPLLRLRRKLHTFQQTSAAADDPSAPLLRRTSVARSDSSSVFNDAFPSKSPKQKPAQPKPTLSEVFTRQSVINLMAYTFLALHSVAYDQLLTIFMHHPRQKPDSSNTHLPFKFSGGFGLGASRIGSFFTLYGVIGCFIQFLIFPPIARKFGVLNCFKCCAIAFPLICFATPYTALIQSPLQQQAVMLGIMVVKSFAVIFAFPCSIILLTNSAASLRVLATLNGVAVSVSAVGRAVGPAVSGVAFTWGLEKGYVITAWWVLGVLASIGAIPIWNLIEMEGFNKSDSDSSSEQDGLSNNFDEGTPSEILDVDEEILIYDDEGALDTIDGPPFTPMPSRGSKGSTEAQSPIRQGNSLGTRMSSPIGLREPVGPGGGRRLSNGLAASNFGQGTGGTSFN